MLINSNDSVGSNHGTPSNVSWVGGKIGQAGSFNGSKIDLTGKTIISGSVFSIACWVKVNAFQNSGKIVAFGSAQTYRNIYIETGNNDNKIHVISWGIPTSLSYELGTDWRHLVVTLTGGILSLYVDGVLATSVTNAGSINVSGSSFQGIGSPIQYNDYFNGLIDEVGIWNRALTSDEITKLYNNGNGLTY